VTILIPLAQCKCNRGLAGSGGYPGAFTIIDVPQTAKNRGESRIHPSLVLRQLRRPSTYRTAANRVAEAMMVSSKTVTSSVYHGAFGDSNRRKVLNLSP
jgi:hypothetical protein